MSSQFKRKDGSLTHEHFQLQEFIQTAQLRVEGLSNDEILAKAKEENIYQFPTSTQIPNFTRGMLNRLDALEDDALVQLVARGPREQAALVNLYAMMRIYKVVASFMVEEIGSRYLTLNYTLDPIDVKAFMTRYRAQNEDAATWSEGTIKRIRSVFTEILVKAGYLESTTSTELYPVYPDTTLVEAIRRNGDSAWLPSFNECMEAF